MARSAEQRRRHLRRRERGQLRLRHFRRTQNARPAVFRIVDVATIEHHGVSGRGVSGRVMDCGWMEDVTMSAHSNGSGPRSNAYSKNKFTNWAEYEPWWLEIQAVFKRFDGRIAKRPASPKVIELKAFDGFICPCSAQNVEAQLMRCPAEVLKGLRAVFILSGTSKQLRSWKPGTFFYGHYWNSCVF